MDIKVEQSVNALPIYEVVSDHGVALSGTGDNLQGLSPFRKSPHVGSFTVCLSRNTFRDWKLDYGGGPVRFVMKLFSLSEEDAVDYLYSKYFCGETPQLKLYVPPKKEERPPLDPEMLDKAYSIFLNLCSLTKDDMDYLKNVRHLTDEEISNFGFKSFPRRTIRQDLQKQLIEAGITPTDVPGFFRYKDDECITFAYYVGIVIPIRNVLGKIVGLQVRKRNLKTPIDKRYVWLSSAFAVNKEGEEPKFFANGRSPESPLGFVPEAFKPKQVTTLFVTEGFFKAISIRKNIKSPTITVQGVTNWKGITKSIEALLERFPKLNRIIFAFDADFICNMNVSTQLCKMYSEINQIEGLTCFTMLWNLDLGKGIDDLIETVKTLPGNMCLMPMELFKKAFEEFEPIGKQMLEDDAEEEVFMAKYSEILEKWKGKN